MWGSLISTLRVGSPMQQPGGKSHAHDGHNVQFKLQMYNRSPRFRYMDGLEAVAHSAVGIYNIILRDFLVFYFWVNKILQYKHLSV